MLGVIFVHRPRQSEKKGGEEKTLMCLSPTAIHGDVEPQKDEKNLAWMNLAYDVYLRVVILQLSLLHSHSLVNYCVIGSNYRQVCLLNPQLTIDLEE